MKSPTRSFALSLVTWFRRIAFCSVCPHFNKGNRVTGRIATVDAEEILGSLTPGKYADLIAVPYDPLIDISTLERVQLVMKGGIVVRDRE